MVDDRDKFIFIATLARTICQRRLEFFTILPLADAPIAE
jgi:hypothetical protein